MGSSADPAPAPDDVSIAEDLQVDFPEARALFRELISVTDEELRALEDRHREQSFFITGVSKAEMLDDIKAELQKAQTDPDMDLETFRERLGEISERYGWKPGQNAYRQRLIFRQNLTNVYQGGRRDQVRTLQDQTEGQIYILYKHGRPFEPRPHHVEWDGTAIEASWEGWDTYWPPNGFNCTCKCFAVDAASLERRGIEPDEDFPSTTPPLPDPGFRSAPASPQARAQQREEMLSRLSDRRRRQVLNEMERKGVDIGG